MISGTFKEGGGSSVAMPGISDREIGRLEQEFADIKHRLRNQKTEIEFLTSEVKEVHVFLVELRTRIYSVAAVVILFASALAWLVEILGG